MTMFATPDTCVVINNDIRITNEHLSLARETMEYIDSSPDPFHLTHTTGRILKEAGFQRLHDGTPYKGTVVPGGKYFFTKNHSTLVAFVVGKQYDAANGGGGFRIIGAHTDSPNLRVKPRSKRTGGSPTGTVPIGVECYGGGLWHTWFDRDLGLSGRVLVRTDGGKRIQQRLVKIDDRALLRVSNLCIHLQSAEERKAFKVNKEDHLSPILAMEAEKQLTGGTTPTDPEQQQEQPSNKKAKTEANNGWTLTKDPTEDSSSSSSSLEEPPKSDNKKAAKTEPNGWIEHQEPLLVSLLAEKLGVATGDILDFELNLFDIQKGMLGGARSEFIHQARLDNQASCFIAVRALLAEHDNADADDNGVSMIVLYDHEEVGSESAIGAASPIMKESIRAIASALDNTNNDPQDTYKSVLSKSFVISCDQAHAIHPNYLGKHEKQHAPKLNHGMVIKRNANQRYASTIVASALLRQVVCTANDNDNNADGDDNDDDKKPLRRRRISPPYLQEFIVRQDCGCGSTIGPIISTTTGIRTIDVGMPSLSMHSIRESMGVYDLTHGLEIFKAFFRYFAQVDSSFDQHELI